MECTRLQHLLIQLHLIIAILCERIFGIDSALSLLILGVVEPHLALHLDAHRLLVIIVLLDRELLLVHLLSLSLRHDSIGVILRTIHVYVVVITLAEFALDLVESLQMGSRHDDTFTSCLRGLLTLQAALLKERVWVQSRAA